MFRYQTQTLSNGIRIAHRKTNSRVAYMVVIVNAGSRDERPEHHGIAHFTEHMLFKGTQLKNTRQIIRHLEDVGGDVDAFTTKEDTVLYAALPAGYFSRAAGLFADILFNSRFPEKEMEKERAVILDEINSYKDNPMEQIYEDFEGMVFRGHPLGRNILGTRKTLRSIGQKEMTGYTTDYFVPENMVVCTMGNLTIDTVCREVDQHFGKYSSRTVTNNRLPFSSYKPSHNEVKKRAHQLHCVIGAEAYGYNNERRIPFALITNILGGPAMLSRLNMLLREKHGLVYHVEASNAQYSDTGLFAVYFGCDEKNYSKSYRLVMAELERMAAGNFSARQLSQAKQQYLGQILVSMENPESVLMAMGKTLQNKQQKFSSRSIIQQIQNISVSDIRDAAGILSGSNLSVLVYH